MHMQNLKELQQLQVDNSILNYSSLLQQESTDEFLFYNLFIPGELKMGSMSQYIL